MSLRSLAILLLVPLWPALLSSQEKAKKAPPERPTPTVADYVYAHDHERQKFDFWQAKSDKPTPVVLLIHGGGWKNGDKTGYGTSAIQPYLDAGISVASINYRFIDQAMEQKVEPPVKACLYDAGRALQTIRSKAKEWNVDPRRIGATGSSAGACTSLWLALHDDLADPKSSDPVARQSSRLTCAAVSGAQTSLDPKELREWIPNAVYGGHAFGFADLGRTRAQEFDLLIANREKVLPWIKEYSPIELVTKDDPPIYLDYPNQKTPPMIGQEETDPTHSAMYGVQLEKRLKAAGVECVLSYPGHQDEKYGSISKFLIAKLMVDSKAGAAWAPAKGPLMTRWAKDVSPEKVHPEYPRPQLVRENWTNLNGLWDYAVRPAAESQPDKWDGQILVPFPIESALSGVMKRVAPTERLWYHRTFKTPQLKEGRRLLLNFGAVDWQCEAFVNGKSVGKHTGGYDPFTFDVTDALAKDKSEQELVVAVNDPSDTNWQPRGKQVVNPKGIWYTPTTGIWQTVWMEEAPNIAIESLTAVPDLDAGVVRVSVKYAGGRNPRATSIKVLDGNRIVAEGSHLGPPPFEIKVPNAKSWNPDLPFLYGLQVASVCEGAECDKINSYFAMRKIALGKDEQGVTRLMLNNKPVFQFGPLDQGFWPDGLYTAPTDAAMKYDLEVTKQLGFNMIRKHVKVEPARWYRYCDQMGILVWQDMPSGDKHAPWNPLAGHNGEEIQRSKESADNYRTEWKAIIDSLRSFPSIVVWVPFNEAWGQFDTVAVTKWTEQYDPSRLVNCASGGNDFPVGHISDLHRYPGPVMPALESSRASVLGEFGGLGLPLEGHTWQDKNNWGYRSFTDRETLTAAYEQLIRRLHPLIGKGLCAAVYTQTTDVEVEVNGFMTYDREVIKLDPARTAALHKKLNEPAPREVTLLPTAREQAQVWRYTFDKPAEGWEKTTFDDASWKQGEGGFGEPSTPGSKVRTNWKTPDIWLRRTFELPTGKSDGLALNMHHDEDVEVYLNGVLVFSAKGFITDYALVPLDDKSAAALKPGKNTLAVHCHQTGGGQYVDVGVSRLEEANAK